LALPFRTRLSLRRPIASLTANARNAQSSELQTR
jgi:hypothetical protein